MALVAAVVVTVLAVVFGVAASQGSWSFLGSGTVGGPVTIKGSVMGGEGADIEVYAAPSPDRENPPSCRADSGAVFGDYSGKRISHEGQEWMRIGRVADGWRAGEAVTCQAAPGVESILLSYDGRGRWLVFAIVLGAGAPFLWLFTLVLFSAHRRRRPG
jgi:hypothetical protein